jgi:hypothetical protein
LKGLGIGEAERTWKTAKRNKQCQRARLKSIMTKKQATILVTNYHKRSQVQCVAAEMTGKLCNDDFLEGLKLVR